jgi:hypothetical protein
MKISQDTQSEIAYPPEKCHGSLLVVGWLSGILHGLPFYDANPPYQKRLLDAKPPYKKNGSLTANRPKNTAFPANTKAGHADQPSGIRDHL